MSRSKRLAIVEKLAKQREDQAAAALAQVRAQVAQEQARLGELHSYQQEYAQYLTKQGEKGISMQQWHRTQHFIDQLAGLADRQQSTIASWQQREQQLLETWRQLHQRRQNIAQYIEQISIEEAIAADKAEQKQIDELITLRFGADSTR